MGKLSDIYSSYKRSLDRAQDDYEESVRRSSANAKEFNDLFFKDLTMNLGDRFRNDEFRRGIVGKIEEFFGKSDLNFIAVDGSCHKHNSSEFISFYGGAYGSKGTLILSEDPARIQYKRWEIEKDVSMVAFVPVPYNRISETNDVISKDGNNVKDAFVVSQSDRIELSSIHLPIMQLAEVFLAYNAATSSNLDSPDLILIDNSLSGMLGYTDFGPGSVHLIGHELSDGRILRESDVAVAQAHPFSSELGIPSTKKFSLGFAIIKALHDSQDKELAADSIMKRLGISDKRLLDKNIRKLERHGVVEFDTRRDTVVKKTDPYQSWEQTKSMFQGICTEIFLNKRENALQYGARDENGNTTERWMSPNDIRFMIAIGLRALIEVCWAKKILLTGIVKDSSSTYLTKNYLGVCRHFGKYPELEGRSFGGLPPTDRLFCELLPYINDDLKNPWGTIEFDSTFMTLRVDRREDGIERFGGTFGGITRPERLFLRSIGQFYTRKDTEKILTGHAIFIDRLAYPDWDSRSERLELQDGQLGDMSILLYPYNSSDNIGQLVTYFLLDMITRNLFAEVIGYPDPLHKADQGAKSMRDNVKKLLESSELKFRSRPLTNTLREIRQAIRRQ